jgi:hypothetical protein
MVEYESNKPLSYVSISIPDKPFGTLTDTLGNFTFQVWRMKIFINLRKRLLICSQA